jgi:hypothetical protein
LDENKATAIVQYVGCIGKSEKERKQTEYRKFCERALKERFGVGSFDIVLASEEYQLKDAVALGITRNTPSKTLILLPRFTFRNVIYSPSNESICTYLGYGTTDSDASNHMTTR